MSYDRQTNTGTSFNPLLIEKYLVMKDGYGPGKRQRLGLAFLASHSCTVTTLFINN
jgi:hypothetical protein